MTIFDGITRRNLLTGALATSTVGMLGGSLVESGFAKAPLTNKPAPGFYRFKVGSFEVTVISDGPLVLGPPSADVFKGVSKEDMTKFLEAYYLPTDKVALEQNSVVVNTGKNLVLFDTGVGKDLKAFGPDAGKQLANLKAAGINASDIDAVILTHPHADHCFGIMAANGRRNFPKAQIYMAQADYDFWTDESKGVNDVMKLMVGGARKNLMPNRSRMVFVKDGQEVVPGIQAIATPGHTVGHTSYLITSQNQTLLNLGDVGHSHIISLERPKAEFAFDTDGKLAVESRLKTFDMLSKDRIQMVAYHFPWPGVGYVGKQGDAYRYYPAALRTTL
jgi:glyoxylase-like metal-dependent hydrolase (beta-lactamase superfamily II)